MFGIVMVYKFGLGVRGAVLKEYKNIVFVVESEELCEVICWYFNLIFGLVDFMDYEFLCIVYIV